MRTKLRKLRPGDTIGIISPSAPANPERVKAGVTELEKRGFRVEIPLDPAKFYGRNDYRFSSASSSDRINSLYQLLSKSEVAFLLAARGAYGSSELLSLLDFSKFATAKKAVAGYSDITTLHVALLAKTGLPSIHGGNLTKEFAEASSDPLAAQSVESLLYLLAGQGSLPSYELNCIRSGSGNGPLIAGNLTVLCSMLGTPYDISYDGAILVIEDVGESPYRVHRSLMHLRLAGKFENIQGVVFGRFADCKSTSGPTVSEVIDKSVEDFFFDGSYPILRDLEFGHTTGSSPGVNIALPLGCEAKIDDRKFSLAEWPVE